MCLRQQKWRGSPARGRLSHTNSQAVRYVRLALLSPAAVPEQPLCSSAAHALGSSHPPLGRGSRSCTQGRRQWRRAGGWTVMDTEVAPGLGRGVRIPRAVGSCGLSVAELSIPTWPLISLRQEKSFRFRAAGRRGENTSGSGSPFSSLAPSWRLPSFLPRRRVGGGGGGLQVFAAAPSCYKRCRPGRAPLPLDISR